MRKQNPEKYIKLLSEAGIELNRAWDIVKVISRAFNATTSDAVIRQFIARKWTAWEIHLMAFNRTWKKSPDPENVFAQEDELLGLGCEVGLTRQSLARLYGKLTPSDLMDKIRILQSLGVDPWFVVSYHEQPLLAHSAELQRRLSLGKTLGLRTEDILITFKAGSQKKIVNNLGRVKRQRLSAYSKIWTRKREIAALKNEAVECKKRAKILQSLIDLAGNGNTTENADGQT